MRRSDIEIKTFDSSALRDPFASVPPELRSLVSAYLGRRQGDVQNLLGMIASGDFYGIRDIGHRLKGSGAGYGFMQISEVGTQLETAGREGDRAGAKQAALKLATVTDYLVKRNV